MENKAFGIFAAHGFPHPKAGDQALPVQTHDVPDSIGMSRVSVYQRYIQSDAWRNCAARRVELELSGGCCRLCGRGRDVVRIEIHHRSYANVGCERPEDLCTLCGDCHLIVTAELRRRKLAVLTLPDLRDTRRTLPDNGLPYWGAADA